ncbi:MAG: branched-chain amino acid ABC transporter permease [Actinomycetota bacterium]|jgi:branched-chain amino acid transport system permease protein
MAARRAALSAVLAIAAVGWPWVLPESTHFYGVLSVAYALVALSLTVLSGWAGQISLCQAAFLGIGVFLSAPLLDAGLPLPLVLLIAGAAGAAVSLVIGLPSLRLRGVYLAVVTLAFGAAAEKYFFPLRGYDAKPVARPTILGMSTASERNLYLVAVAVLGIALLVAGNLRRSDVGRALFAIRDSEEAAMAMGIRIARYKLGAFAFSAALATVAGVLYAVLFLSTPSPAQFGVLQSLFLLALPVIGGLETLAGPIVGGIIMGTSQPVVDAFDLRLFLVSGLLLVSVTLTRRDGLVGLAVRLGRSAREQLAPQTVPCYGSFLPEERTADGDGRAVPRVKLRAPALPVGSRLRLRLRGAR